MIKTLKNKILLVVVIIAAIVIGIAYFNSSKGTKLGAVSGQLIEDVQPYFRNNGGMNTALPVQFSGGATLTGTLSQTGAATLSGSTTITSGLTVGAAGTPVTQVNKGTCILYQYVNTIAATSSITTDCVATTSSGKGTDGGLVALAGIVVGDQVFATLSTSTSALVATAGGLVLTGASASTTAGYITVTLTNLKGTTFTYPIGASSTVSYFTIR